LDTVPEKHGKPIYVQEDFVGSKEALPFFQRSLTITRPFVQIKEATNQSVERSLALRPKKPHHHQTLRPN
jgi:hypothetical protein